MDSRPCLACTGAVAAAAVLLAVTSAGCGAAPPGQASSAAGPAPISAAAPDQGAKTAANPWSACYADFKPTGNPQSDLARLTTLCGQPSGMQPLTPVTTAEQAEKQPVDRYTFYVPKAGTCYRVYATGDRNIHDLDLLVRDSAGQVLGGDITHDTWPIVPPEAPLCIDQPGLYMLEVSVFSGSGRYAVQVWGNQGKLAK